MQLPEHLKVPLCFCCLVSSFTFQLLDMPWSQISSLLHRFSYVARLFRQACSLSLSEFVLMCGESSRLPSTPTTATHFCGINLVPNCDDP